MIRVQWLIILALYIGSVRPQMTYKTSAVYSGTGKRCTDICGSEHASVLECTCLTVDPNSQLLEDCTAESENNVTCTCRSGYKINEARNDLACDDVNECIDPTACGDQCVNNIGGHECECKEGRVAVDTQNCRDASTFEQWFYYIIGGAIVLIILALCCGAGCCLLKNKQHVKKVNSDQQFITADQMAVELAALDPGIGGMQAPDYGGYDYDPQPQQLQQEGAVPQWAQPVQQDNVMFPQDMGMQGMAQGQMGMGGMGMGMGGMQGGMGGMQGGMQGGMGGMQGGMGGMQGSPSIMGGMGGMQGGMGGMQGSPSVMGGMGMGMGGGMQGMGMQRSPSTNQGWGMGMQQSPSMAQGLGMGMPQRASMMGGMQGMGGMQQGMGGMQQGMGGMQQGMGGMQLQGMGGMQQGMGGMQHGMGGW